MFSYVCIHRIKHEWRGFIIVQLKSDNILQLTDLPLVLFLLWNLAACRRQAHEDLERVVSVPVSITIRTLRAERTSSTANQSIHCQLFSFVFYERKGHTKVPIMTILTANPFHKPPNPISL